MKLFLKKIAILFLPVIFIFAFPVFIEIYSGEFLNVDSVIKKWKNNNESFVYGPAYSDKTTYYKMRMVKEVNPTILAIGNSKILTLRAGFFKEGVTFYNAGGVAPNVASFEKFLAESGVTPSVIIMTVEPLHFDPSVTSQKITNNLLFEDTPYVEKIGSIISRSWFLVYKDYIADKFTVHDVLYGYKKNNSVGLNALITGSGIRKDGSNHYGKQYENKDLREEKMKRAITFIETKNSTRTEEEFSSSALNELDKFLLFCKEKHIYVIGYIPPTPKIIEDTYKKYSKYNFLFKTHSETLPVFAKHGFTVYDFFSLQSLDVKDDTGVIDEYHTDERIMVLTLLKISEKNSILSKFVSKEFLRTLVRDAKDGNDILR